VAVLIQRPKLDRRGQLQLDAGDRRPPLIPPAPLDLELMGAGLRVAPRAGRRVEQEQDVGVARVGVPAARNRLRPGLLACHLELPLLGSDAVELRVTMRIGLVLLRVQPEGEPAARRRRDGLEGAHPCATGRLRANTVMVTKSARRTFRVSLFRELAAAESPIRTAFDPVLERAAIGASDDYRREQGVNHRLSYASAGLDWWTAGSSKFSTLEIY
jgi:hypothetical protein